MNILSLNRWGSGNPRTVRSLKRLNKIHHPDIIFLSETMMASISFNKIFFNFKSSFNNYYVMDATSSGGRAWGLIFSWNYDVKLTIHNANYNYIDFYFECPSTHNLNLLVFMVFLLSLKKQLTFFLLTSLKNFYAMNDWIVCGYF